MIFITVYLIGNHFFEIPYLLQVANPARIAVLHSIFNIGTTILLFPFVSLLEKLADKVIKEDFNMKEVFIDERLLLSPELAIIEANQKLIYMTDLVKNNLVYSTKLLKNYQTKKAMVIAQNDQLINSYEGKLKSYLIKVSNKELSEETSNDIARLLLTINDFKQIQNSANNIFKIAEQKFSNKIDFSDELIDDLRIIVKKVRAIIRTTQGVISNFDIKLVQEVEVFKQNIDDLIFKSRNKHIQNVQIGKLPLEFDYLILNLFTDLDRVAEHCLNVTLMILEKEKNKTLVDFVYAW